jgi:hypothetical protein
MAGNKFNVVKFLVVVLFVFALNEIACRLLLPPPQHIITSVKSREYAGPQQAEKKQLSIHEHPDEGGLYRGSPAGRRLNPNRVVTIENHRLSHKKVVIETNSIGYRNPEIPVKPDDPNYKRILFLGDSIIFQDYLNEDETIVRQVETHAHADHKNWETINAGVGAISLKTELAILLETGLSLKPDVVVLNFYLNDFQESKGVDIIKLPVWLEHSRFLYQVSTLIAQQYHQQKETPPEVEKVQLAQWQSDFEKNHRFAPGLFNESPEAFNSLIRDSFSDFGGAWSPAAWDYMRPLLEELKRLSIEHHFKLVIVFHAAYYQAYTEFVDDYPQQQMKLIGKEMDIPVLDLLPPLRAEALRVGGPAIYHGKEFHSDIFYDQNHHTEAGSALVANQIYSFLSNNL